MTIQTCNTPKIGKYMHNKNTIQMENRVIGVEVYCGNINTLFIYYTDDLVSGGANIMIEIQREGKYVYHLNFYNILVLNL